MRSTAERLRTAALPLVLLLVVVAVGAALRLTGLDWDSGRHLHPDERYVTMVADAVSWPSSPREYLDVDRSPLSPYGTEVGRDYVYGQLPLSVTTAVGAVLGRDGYDQVHLVGRALSALLDTLSIVLVFLLARLVLAARPARLRDAGALLAATAYAVTVTAIQHAHFFTMESWLVATTLLAFWLAARLAGPPPATGLPLLSLVGVGAAVGLTAATKLSGLLVVAPVTVAVLSVALARPADSRAQRALGAGASLLTVAASAYVVFRAVSPYAFANSNWLDVRPNAGLRRALESQERALDGEFLFPPAYQWLLSEPWLDPLRNVVVWGLGVPLGLTALSGLALLAAGLVRGRLAGLRRPDSVVALMLLLFVAVVFAQFASRFAHSIRYLLPIAPFLCVAAAFGLVVLRERRPWAARLAAGAVLGATLLYALAFVQVYRAPSTRVVASEWLLANVEPGGLVVNEHWDDGLPVGGSGGRFEQAELPVFDPDDDAKLRKLYDGLARADMYVLSSPRAWRTIGRLPDLFPLMTRFYDELAEGRLGFAKVAQFESPPRLAGVELEDLEAEEPFWVYDHPPVIVYARRTSPSFDEFRTTICAGRQLPGC